MSLTILPIELLDQILSYRVSHCAILLWKCGCKVLNNRLVNGGCTIMELKDTIPGSSSRWPRFIKQLRFLRVLRVNRRGEPLDSIVTIRKELRQLSSRLEVLDLQFQGCIDVFKKGGLSEEGFGDDLAADYDALLSSLHFGNNYDIIRAPTGSGPSMWDLNTRFPSLRELAIGQTLDVIYWMRDLDFAQLPRSLTYLEIRSSLRSHYHWERLDLLPRGIETLILHLRGNHDDGVLNPSQIRGLPPSLTSISGMQLGLYRPHAWPGLPGEVPTIEQWKADLLESFPPGLTSMEFEDKVSAEDCDLVFPRTLTTIELSYKHSPEFMLTVLPPHLTSLTFGREVRLRSEVIRCLPRLLKYLRCENVVWHGVKAEDLPPSLESLEIGEDAFPRIAQPLLTPSLLHFRATLLEPAVISSFSQLPPCLTSLHITLDEDVYIEADASLSLPRSITALTLNGLVPAPDNAPDFLSHLPPGITTLILGLQTSREYPHEAFHNLPKGLTDLEINSRASRVDSAVFFAYLPRSLTRFSCQLSEIFVSSHDLAALPPQLKVFDLDDAVFASPHFMTLVLPRSLRHLSLGGATIDAEDIKNLPSGLRSLYAVTIKSFAPRHLLNFPRRLKRLTCALSPSCKLQLLDFLSLPKTLLDVELGVHAQFIWNAWKDYCHQRRLLPFEGPESSVS